MTLELKLCNFLKSRVNVPVCYERPEKKPESYVLIERTGGNEKNYISSATVDIISVAGRLNDAIELDRNVRMAMRDVVSVDNISGCNLNANGNWTDPTTREYRYHST